MKECSSRIVVLSIFFVVFLATSSAQTAALPLPPAVKQVLTWLPGDTETIIVGQGPFTIPQKHQESTGPRQPSDGAQNVEQRKHVSPLVMLLEKYLFPMRGLEDTETAQHLLPPQLGGRKLQLVVEGSRHFRPPHGLGLMPYEGCTVAVFADDLGDVPASFIQSARTSGLKIEQIAGHEVVIGQEKFEEDVWTYWVAFPRRDVALVATNRDYLQEVLERIHGRQGLRALPDDLQEWRYVNLQSQFWGMRHFDRQQATLDPSSPLVRKGADWPDEDAIGLTFSFDPAKESVATITYLSGNKKILRTAGEHFLNMPYERSAKSWRLTRRELSPGIVRAVYVIETEDSADTFLFMLHLMLGHGVYL